MAISGSKADLPTRGNMPGNQVMESLGLDLGIRFHNSPTSPTYTLPRLQALPGAV
jgi:hypothetical protein